MKLHLVTHFSQGCSYLGIAQNSRLREIPGDMPLCQRHLLCLKVQGNLPDFLAISLQPFFPKPAAICCVALSNPVAGGSIDLV
jgi:hypothetical protein